MQKRAFGIETEYSVACLGKNRLFYTDIGHHGQGEAALFLRRVLPLNNSSPKNLTKLGLFPPIPKHSFWLASNGARLYFDINMTIPEYATPECGNPRETLIHSLAGNDIMEDIRKEVLRLGLLEKYGESKYKDIFVFKMNAHFDGSDLSSQNAVGCHENYNTLSELAPNPERIWEPNHFSDYMVPFLMSRQIFDGAGGIKLSADKKWQYVISQRPVFLDSKLSTRTTAGGGRGFIHFKNEAGEAPFGQTRLHLHCGDSIMSPWGKFISLAATHLALRAYEEGPRNSWKFKLHPAYFIEDFHALASDPALRSAIRVLEGNNEKTFSAIELQKEYINFVEKSLNNFSGEESEMLASWKSMLGKLKLGYGAVSRELDWAIKLNFIKEHLGGNFESREARFSSSLYHDISARGIYNGLLRTGEVLPFCGKNEIEKARTTPPETRAKFRSRFLKILLATGKNNYGYEQWGGFHGLGGETIYLRNPLAETTEEGEKLLEALKSPS